MKPQGVRNIHDKTLEQLISLQRYHTRIRETSVSRVRLERSRKAIEAIAAELRRREQPDRA